MGRTLTYSQPTQTFRSTVTFQQRQIMKAISTLKNGKATGPDEITAEAIKANIETSVSILYKLIKKELSGGMETRHTYEADKERRLK